MTSLCAGTLRLPVAGIGPANPLPPLSGPPPAPYRLDDAEVPERIARNARYGHPATLLPYLTQDGYHRDRVPGELATVVLDNGILRATFVPSLGGRLWSLEDLRTGRQLLYRNPVLQPANLALRNAWFSGGLEFNIGTRGHSPLTCSPLHAARVAGPGGVPALRMWEYERLRGAVFQVDAWLPADATALRVYVRIRNTTAGEVPMYWWSNTAVPEDVRVLAPADRAFRTRYDGSVVATGMPVVDDVDRSYPLRNPHAADYFFDTDGGPRPWIAAVHADGNGLLQCSTRRLRGRKLFVWGTAPGGRRWADWLSPGNPGYAEIQSGLATTQYEHLPMPAGASWSWLETYGAVGLPPASAHGEWPAARAAVQAAAPAATDLAAELTAADVVADAAPVEPLAAGSGWGALERARRRAAGLAWCDETGTPFDEGTLGVEQRPWLAVLRGHPWPEADPADPPVSYPGGAGSEADWSARLAGRPGWRAAYHRAVLAHAEGDADAARECYRASLAAAETPWALRGLALLSSPPAPEDLLAAHRAVPDCWQLCLEAGEALLSADRPEECLALLDAAPDAVAGRGRLRLLRVRAALAAGRVEQARVVLTDGLVVSDLREGEESLDALWEQAFPGRPVPAEYDFRMH